MSDSNITAFDIKLFMGLLIGVVAISTVFGMAGLGGVSTNATDVPEFNPNSNQFDFAGDFPTRPDTESGGVLSAGVDVATTQEYRVLYDDTDSFGDAFRDSTQPIRYNETRLFLLIDNRPSVYYPEGNGSATAGYQVTAYATNEDIPFNTNPDGTQYLSAENINFTDPEWTNQVIIPYDYTGSKTLQVETNDSAGTAPQLSATFTISPQQANTEYYSNLESALPENETGSGIAGGTELGETYNEYQDVDGTLHSATYSIDSVQTPDDNNIIGSLPVIGGVVSGGSSILGGIFLIVEQIVWVFGTIFTVIINTAITIGSAAGFAFSLVAYLITSYAAVVVAAPGGIASTVLAFPGILLGIQSFRLAMVFVNAVWLG